MKTTRPGGLRPGTKALMDYVRQAGDLDELAEAWQRFETLAMGTLKPEHQAKARQIRKECYWDLIEQGKPGDLARWLSAVDQARGCGFSIAVGTVRYYTRGRRPMPPTWYVKAGLDYARHWSSPELVAFLEENQDYDPRDIRAWKARRSKKSSSCTEAS